MPWVEKRVAAGGKPRYVALYRDPTGAKRSADTFPAKVLATRAAYDAARTIDAQPYYERVLRIARLALTQSSAN